MSEQPKTSHEDNRYMVFSRMEIISIMKQLTQSRELISGAFNNDSELLVTTALYVNAQTNKVILDYGPNQGINDRILKAQHIQFETRLDNVKVEFTSSAIAICTFEGRHAFVMPLPKQLLRLQRREYYRLATPLTKPIMCSVSLPDGITREVPLIDISAGGIGVTLSYQEADLLERGRTYADCSIKLPDGVITVTLRVENKFEVTLKNGKQCLRIGCCFQDARANTQSLIQRYIVKLERDRIAADPN